MNRTVNKFLSFAVTVTIVFGLGFGDAHALSNSNISSCKKVGARSGTPSRPLICRKVSGRLRWVVLKVQNELTPSATTTSQVVTTVGQTPSTNPNSKSTTSTSGGGASNTGGSSNSRTSSTSTTAAVTTTTASTIPVACPNSQNVTAEIWGARDGGYRIVATSAERTYHYGRLGWIIFRNNSEVAISVEDLSISGIIWRSGVNEGAFTFPVVRPFTLNPGERQDYMFNYSALPQRATSTPDVNSLSRGEVIQNFSIRSLDSRC